MGFHARIRGQSDGFLLNDRDVVAKIRKINDNPCVSEPSSQLPIYAQKDAIIDALANSQVIIVRGPPGCGKTTQLPRILQHHNPNLRIGVTQPRRIAAISVAARIAEEDCVTLGQEVGYSIRFDDCTSPRTHTKIMTDGILLQEARTDPYLSNYDVIMVDEAHERSLNIDFALGLLHEVLKHRPDFRVIVSSATMDVAPFQRFFQAVAPNLRVVDIDTRTFPLTIHHQSLKMVDDEMLCNEVVDKIRLIATGTEPGHVLVFLPGEGVINKISTALLPLCKKQPIVVIPLYGRLRREEQHLVFDEFEGKRKIVLATNIAETSITIVDVRFVIDTGLAKVPWFDERTGVATLRQEFISKASADQRAGRAGRTAPGVVYRLYDQQKYESAIDYTPEEITRVDLAEAVLRLISLGIQDVEHFEFPTRPPLRKLRGALDSLKRLGAIDREHRLTVVGRRMVPFPLSPALSRMVAEALAENAHDARDVLILAAWLSTRSPYRFPQGEEEQARKAQRNLAHESGDALTAIRAVHLWQKASDKHRFCDVNYLDADSMAFIDKAQNQLADIAEEMGALVGQTPTPPALVERCMTVGFSDTIMARQGFMYETRTGLTVSIHPGSALWSSRTRFAVAADMMRSGKTYAYFASAISPTSVAEFAPEFARTYGVKTVKKPVAAAKPEKTEEAHKTARLGGIDITLHHIRGKQVARITIEQAKRITPVEISALPRNAQKWRMVLELPYGVLNCGPLIPATRWIGLIPWPTEKPKRGPPIGAVLEWDRNLHTIERFAGHVLLPAKLPDGAKSYGFLMLVANDDGGYWFDVARDFLEAASSSLAALQNLQERTNDENLAKPIARLEQLIQDARG